MSCVNLQNIFVPIKGDDGFTHYHNYTVPCGKCPECLKSRSREWSLRVMQEASFHNKNCFITLTYNDDHLPPHGSLVKKHLQDFLKRLRRRHDDISIRYFACGEYGSKGLRPHYHLILFGFDFADKSFFRQSSRGEYLYRSEELESLWQFGYSSIGELTIDSARYCAKYLQKLNDPPPCCIRPFTCMSLKPGIGFNAIDDKSLDVGCYYYNGQRYNIPRYYLKVLERNGACLDEYKSLRVANAIAYSAAQSSKYDRDYIKCKNLFEKYLT